MATWAEFEDAEPDLAAFARERMRGRIVYQATLRLDGGPRVHPVSPWNRRRPAVRLVPRHEPEDARGRARRDEAVATEYSDDEMPVYRRWRASPA